MLKFYPFLHHYKLVTVALRWVNFICTWWINSIDYQQPILANAKLLAAKTRVRVSFPLIPGYNDSEENVLKTAAFAKSIGVEWIDVNPLHTLGKTKYLWLRRKSPYSRYREPTSEEILRVRDLIQSEGLKTTVGRMM